MMRNTKLTNQFQGLPVTVIRLALCLVILISAGLLPVAQPVYAQSGVCVEVDRNVAIPLTELGNRNYVRMDGQVTDYTGGLYPNGSNQRPPQHETAGLAAAARITPLNAQGQPDANRGRIVMISLGMSNANMEFDTFISQASNDRSINPKLLLINGAIGGQTADKWIDPNAQTWQYLQDTLTNYGVTSSQVQVAWVKQTLTRGGDFPAKAQELEGDLQIIVQLLKDKFPNLQIAYLSSRTRSYTYERGLSPEPVAYETGFAVKWLIEKQIQGDAALNYDPARGPVTAPFLSWGPYLWANGETPRTDGFTWLAEDMTNDCTHPSPIGREKIAGLLMNFFKEDTTTQNWFLANHSPAPSPSIAPTHTVIHTVTRTATNRPQTATATPRVTAATATMCGTGAPCPTLPSPGSSGGPNRVYLALIIGSVMLGAGFGWWGLHRKT